MGLTTSADALRPVVRTTGTGDGSRSLLHYILERHDTSLAEIVEWECGDYRRETDSYTTCIHDRIVERFLYRGVSSVAAAGSMPENELTRCLVGHYENYCRWKRDNYPHNNVECDEGVEMAAFLSGRRSEVVYDPLQNGPHNHHILPRFNVLSGFPCRDVAEEHLAKFGIEVHYCDECDDPNKYHLSPSE